MKRSMTVLAMLAGLAVSTAAQQAAPPAGQPQQDPFARHLFSPELVMQHQGEINLTDAQRQALSQSIQQAQTKMLDTQWKLSDEAQKLIRVLQGATVDETQALEQVDRILTLEREVKRAQMGLMVRIKNTLTPSQQARLRALRGEG
jgi:Spy/CpxP family protein refolding chaperone